MSPEQEENGESNSDQENDASEQITTSATKSATKRRTKTGCLTCRKRRIKCGEERPICKNCIKSKRECAGYNPPQLYKHQTGDLSSTSAYSSTQSNNYVSPEGQYNESRQHDQYGLYPNGDVASNDFNSAYRHFSTSGHPLPYNQDFHPIQPITGIPSQLGTVTADFPRLQWPQANLEHDLVVEESRGISNASDMSSRHTSLPFIDTSGSGQPLNHYTPSSIHSSVIESSLASSTSIYPSSSASAFNSRHSVSGSAYGPPQDPHTSLQLDYSNHNSQDAMIGSKVESHDHPLHTGSIRQPENATNNSASLRYTLIPNVDNISQSAIPQDSPLLSNECRPVFQHFLDFTGPCMCIFDRLEDLGPHEVPRMAWTDALPALALKHEALAHSILAVGALHLARLQRGSMNAAMKHFSLALGRVGKLLGPEDTRHHISTLATVLLLAYYEVMAGDHSRWSLHLSGAARLVMEHDYSGLTRSVRRLRAQAKSNIDRLWVGQHTVSTTYLQQITGISEMLLDDKEWEVNEELVSNLMGIEVHYDDQYQTNFQEQSDTSGLSDAEIENLRTLKELYWWYCKQDIFQSMLSGDPLMLPYSKWKHCPPRGQIGNADRAHATADYLWLLMARLVTFGARDRIRKQRVVTAQGGEWIPPPGFLPRPPMQPGDKASPVTQQPNAKVQTSHDRDEASRHIVPPTANEGRARRKPTTTPSTSGAPMMYGMIPPPTGPIHMSSSFEVMDAELQKDAQDSPESSIFSESLECDLNKSLDEHSSITRAFDRFVSCLGPDFEPTPVEQHLTTPFGPAMNYKSPTISAMWTFYHVGRILLRRYHPHSPPAAMVSAGVNASVTLEHAQMIGRICAGLYVQYSQLSQAGFSDRMFTAAIMETTFSLLFAGVQYTDPIQRGWTISKLSEISELGWASSASIASACEAMWEKLGMAGKGPPYLRTIDNDSSDARVWRKEVTDTSSLSEKSRHDRGRDLLKEHESRFVSHDRNLIVRHGSTRAYWALGLLSVEDDLEKMRLTDQEEGGDK